MVALLSLGDGQAFDSGLLTGCRICVGPTMRYCRRLTTHVYQTEVRVSTLSYPARSGSASAPSPHTPLSADERERYARHLVIPEVGERGQQRLRDARVLVVGAGGLGAPLLAYLAAVGVGTIGIAEFDTVERSNLQRQVLFGTQDVGRPKADAAADALLRLNPHVHIEQHGALTAENALELVRGYDVVADGTDNFAARYLVNDACVLAGVPNVYGSVRRFQGQVSVFAAPGGPNYRDLYPAPPPPGLAPSCAEAGVLGVMPGIIGAIQGAEVLKLVLGIGEPLVGRVLVVDGLTMRFRSFAVDSDPANPLTGDAPTLSVPTAPSGASCASAMASVPEITVLDLKKRLDSGETPFLLDVREPHEYEIANLGGALVPLQSLSARLDELREHRDDDILVVHCRSGARSANAVAFLRENGFENAVNLKGGILAWSDQVDPSLPKY